MGKVYIFNERDELKLFITSITEFHPRINRL